MIPFHAERHDQKHTKKKKKLSFLFMQSKFTPFNGNYRTNFHLSFDLYISAYPSTRNNDHGGCDDIVLIQITSHVQITLLRVAVTKQPGLPCCLKALREWHVIVPIPAPKRRNSTPLTVILLTIKPQTICQHPLLLRQQRVTRTQETIRTQRNMETK
jgi:hypothetical protein